LASPICRGGVRFSDGFARDVKVLDFGGRVFVGKGSDVEVRFSLDDRAASMLESYCVE